MTSFISDFIKKPLESFKSKMSIFRELLHFLWVNKLWWMMPMVFVLLIIGVILVISQSSVVAPFIYALF